MELFPDFKTVLTLGPLHITWYAVFILSGAMIAYWLSIRQLKKWGYDTAMFEDFFIYMLPIGIFGARLYYVIFEWATYASEPIRIFYIWEGGLAIHGGVIAATLFGLWYFRNKVVDGLRVMDAIFPNVLIAQALGRWGNFMNQEAYGDIVNASYYDGFPAFIRDQMFIDGAYRQPAFLYESMANLVGWALITFVYKKYGRKKRGDLFFAYVIWYGVVRFFIEMMRTDALMLGPLKMAQVISLAGVAFGVCGILGVWDKLFKNIWPFKRQKPVVLFDLDGTLIDTKELIFESFRHCFEKYKPDQTLSEQELYSFLGPTLRGSFEQYFPADQVDEIIDYYREFNHEKHDKLAKPFDGAKETLQTLMEQGYSVGIVSNKVQKTVKMGLRLLNLEEEIEVIVGAEDIQVPKPSPEGILLACQRLYHNHDDVIYVGDSYSDIQACKNMGGYSIEAALDETRSDECKDASPCAVIHNLKEILDLVKEDREWSDVTI